MRATFELTGATPLLMHPDDIEAADALDAWRKAPENKNISKAGDDRSPAWTWHHNVYSDGANVVIPSQNLMVCLRTAGTRKIMKKQTTFKEITQSGIMVDREFLEFKGPDGIIHVAKIQALRNMEFAKQAEEVKKLGFRLFVKRAKIGQSKHIRVRPRFEKWTLSGGLEVTAKEITFDILQELFELAGHVGLGDWRPGCKTPGPYGMFTSKVKRA